MFRGVLFNTRMTSFLHGGTNCSSRDNILQMIALIGVGSISAEPEGSKTAGKRATRSSRTS